MTAVRLVAVVFAFLVVGTAADEPLTVTIPDGTLQGAVVGAGRQFLGIPFAAPPVGSLRFRRPVPPTPWQGVRNAMFFAPDCAQQKTGYINYHNISEDCLYLNVFATLQKPAAPLPVMVFFYGGSWEWGGTSFPIYDGIYDENMLGDVVIVTTNYRMGPFGFAASPALQAEDSLGSTGNYGIQDQRMALTWIRNNIQYFNGDPTRVTIWGQSAGGGSVSCHLTMPASWDLFHRAIMESGPPANWTTVSLATQFAHYDRIVAKMKCNGTDTQKLACLRAAPMELLIDDQSVDGNAQVGWSPTVDGVELTDIPPQLVRHGKFKRVPVLFGSNKDEGSTFVDGLDKNANATQYVAWLGEKFGEWASRVAAMYPAKSFEAPWFAASRLIGDYAMSCPTRRNARWFTQASGAQPVFEYFFTRAPLVTRVVKDLGVFHGAELPFVFNFVFLLVEEQERILARKVSTYWTNFAINGTPNMGRNVSDIWPQYTVAADTCLDLDIVINELKALKQAACNFWDTFYDAQFPS